MWENKVTNKRKRRKKERAREQKVKRTKNNISGEIQWAEKPI